VVQITPVGRQVVSAAEDQKLKVWNPATGKEVRTLDGHSGTVWAVAIGPDGLRAVAASDDRAVKVWDLATGIVLATFTTEAALYTCAVASDGRTISAGDQRGHVHFLKLEMPALKKGRGLSDQEAESHSSKQTMAPRS
jgi:WD40 repeat protein